MERDGKNFGIQIVINNKERGVYPLTFTSQEEATTQAEAFEKKQAHKVEWRKNGYLATRIIPLEEGQNYLRCDGINVQMKEGELRLVNPTR